MADEAAVEMSDEEPPLRMCGYVLCVICYIASCVFVWFGYSNNAWLIIRDPDGHNEFQRGLNDDCLRSDKRLQLIQCSTWGTVADPFPEPFDNIANPSIILYLAMYIARLLCIWPLFWLMFSVACCFNAKCEDFAKKKTKLFVHILAVGGGLFVLLFLILFMSLYTTTVVKNVPEGYDMSLGLGFYLFVIGGAIAYVIGSYFFYQDEINEVLVKRFSCLNQALQNSHQPVSTDYPVSMNSIRTSA